MPKIVDLNPLSNIPRVIGGTDLAIPFRAFGKIGLVYGDTFGKKNGRLEPVVGGDDWRSPVIVWTDPLAKATDPIRVSSAVKGGDQLWPYPHNNDKFSTVLPTDAIEIDGRLYIWVMVTKRLANEQWCELAYSDDRGENWVTGPQWSVRDFGGKRVMVTFDRKPGSDWVDIFSTGGLARDKGMIRFRCHKDKLLDPAAWSGWGWEGGNWGWDRYPSEILPGWRFGEICFRWIQGNAVLSGFDAGNYSAFIKVGADTDADWTKAKTHRPVTGMPRGVDTVPRLYGCYVHPDSKLSTPNGVALIVSQWHQSDNPYRATQFSVTEPVLAVGPIVETVHALVPSNDKDIALLSKEDAEWFRDKGGAPEVYQRWVELQKPPAPVPPQVITPPATTPPPTPAPDKDVKDMTAQEVLELVAQQLAASGDVKLSLPDGSNVTLREALGVVLWKESAQLRLDGRPVSPTVEDDQYGHVLSTRAEHLVTQALIEELCAKTGINTAAIRNRVLGGLS